MITSNTNKYDTLVEEPVNLLAIYLSINENFTALTVFILKLWTDSHIRNVIFWDARRN